MMNLIIYAENHGKRNTVTFAKIELKREIKEATVFVLKAKTDIKKVLEKLRLFKDDKSCIQLKKETIYKN